MSPFPERSLRGSSTSCACWFTSRFWDTRRNTAMTNLASVANIPGRSTLRASSCGNLVVPRTRRRIGDRGFSVAAPRAWNRLPTELKLLRSTDSFRRDLKHFSSILSMVTRIRIDSVMRPRSSSRVQYKCLSYSYSYSYSSLPCMLPV